MSNYNNFYKKSILSLLLAFILGMVILGTPTVGVTDDSGIAVYVDPPVIWDPDMEIGTQFSIDICVQNVENLWAYQFWLKFDPQVLHGVPVSAEMPAQNGPFLGKDTDPDVHPVKVAPGPGFDNDVGELKLFGAFLYFEETPPRDWYLADGSGVLATVTFEVVGYGCSPITLGTPQTGLSNKTAGYLLRNVVTGEWEWCYGEILVEEPGMPPKWVPYEPWQSSLGDGIFFNEAGPELYIRRRGAHGASGTWPEWVVGDSEMEQTLYSRIMNYGFMGAWVEVEFVIRSELNGIKIMSDQVWIDPAIDKGEPSEVTVSVSFTPEIIGKYWVYGTLYFKAGCMEEKVPYYLIEDVLGGEGISRDICVGFKVQEHV